MLVLQRYTDQEIVLIKNGQELARLIVVDIRSNENVRLGFIADPSIEIHRLEVWKGIQRSRAAAAQALSDT
jgi:sRNA-binding carbon storage regulator CsrA